MNTPIISVVMPVYNGEKYLRESIDSILNQTFTNFEFIIINDGSTDKSEEIILSYNDPRIRYIKNEHNLKIVKTLNKGLKLAKGQYIARMDADDISLPSRFKIQVDFLEKHHDIGLIGSFYKRFGGNNQVVKVPLDNKEIHIELLFNTPFGHPTIMFRCKLIQENNVYYENYQDAEDYYFFYCVSKITKLANINKVLLLYRVHSEQISSEKYLEQMSTASKIRAIILSNELNLSINDCLNFQTLVRSVADNKKTLKIISFWIEQLILLNKQYDQALFEKIIRTKYKEFFRRSVRKKGLLLWPIYWKSKKFKKSNWNEVIFFILTSLSWVKNRFIK